MKITPIILLAIAYASPAVSGMNNVSDSNSLFEIPEFNSQFDALERETEYLTSEQEDYLYTQLTTLQVNSDVEQRKQALGNLKKFATEKNVNHLSRKYDRSILFWAVHNLLPHNAQSKEFVQYLLEIGADANLAEQANVTPLHEAVKAGSLELVHMLIVEGGADVTAADDFGRTALSIAAYQGALTIYLYLNNHMWPDSAQQTPLQVTEGKSTPESFNGYDLDYVNEGGNGLLHLAAFTGNTDAARQLVSLGLEVNFKNNKGNTPLHIAAGMGNYETAMILLENGADFSLTNEALDTPLHSAVSDFLSSDKKEEKGRLRIVKQLLGMKANINAKDIFGAVPLHWASASGRRDAVVTLIFHGAEIDVRDQYGNTPESVARTSGFYEIADILQRNL